MRSITRITGVSINTVTKLLSDAGEACASHHDAYVRDVRATRVECEEIWSFIYAKDKNVKFAKKAPKSAGNAWTWTAIDSTSKLLISYVVGDRTSLTALYLMDDLRERIANRVQLTTDGHKPYLEAVEAAFGGDVDYAMLVKLYGTGSKEDERRYSPAECIGTRKLVVSGLPDPTKISTSYVERHNLTMRMGMRRFIRLTNAFSKRIEKHAAMVALYATHYNFCRVHKTLRVTPAMEAGLDRTVRDPDWIVQLMDAKAPKPNRPKKYKKRISNWDTTGASGNLTREPVSR